AWTLSSQGAGGEGDFTATPIVVDGYVFAGTNRGWIFAMNADTGQLIWKTKAPVGSVNASVAVAGGLVYANVSAPSRVPGTTGSDTGPYMMALDEATGAVRWTTFLDSQVGADVYASPLVFNGTVITGVSGSAAELGPKADRYVFEGSLNFLDAATGQFVKKTYAIPQEDWADGYAGGGIWATPAVDAATSTAYVGVGNPFQKEKEHPNTDAILKFDVDRSHAGFGGITGVYKGNFDTYADVHNLPCVPIPGNKPPYYPQGLGACGQIDLDFGASPNLFTGPDGRLQVGEAQKAGVYHVVDAATMTRAWKSIVAPPVPTVGGIVGSTAYDGSNVYGPEVVGGYLWSVSGTKHLPRWVAPVAGGLDESNPVSVANGVVYNVDTGGFLDAYDADTGAPLLHRPMVLGSGTGTGPASSWGGVAIARNTVYAATGVTGLANGFIIAFKPGASEDGGPGGVPGLSGVGVNPTVLAGPGAYATTYATPVMSIRAGGVLQFANADLPQHDVVAADSAGGAPLFRSHLAGIGEVVPVTGADKLAQGKYGFYCSIHPGMTGTLLVLP
ncbi:MAG: hypothetical protein QOE92_1485, partial [Chloroflexota bacterium]|nr:hypothetical protein [Chloroflexota bacterium]